MPSLYTIKEQETVDTPLLLCECTLPGGATERWCTHQVVFDGETYAPRVVNHNAFDVRLGGDDVADGPARVSLTLANADSYFSQLERTLGFKGARLTLRLAFFDLKLGTATSSNSRVVFRGACSGVEEITEVAFRLGFTNRLSLQRLVLPNVRVQRRCPWTFPATGAAREEAVNGGAEGRYSSFYACGYSADVAGGVGNLDGATPFASCDYTRASCEQRGMFAQDGSGHATRRFGGIEFVPATTLVRSHGEKQSHLSVPAVNEGKYNEAVPMVYGTAWYTPPMVFSRNDGNLTRMEVLLGVGEIQSVLKVVVNRVDIPAGEAGRDMTATGWYRVVSLGQRTGAFNSDVVDAAGNPIGDPYGSLAYLSVVVPNSVAGSGQPHVDVLVQGLKLPRFDGNGAFLDEFFTANPAWVALDVLRRTGWQVSELDLGSFATAAQYCDELLTGSDGVQLPRYRCNTVLRRRRAAAEILKGIRNGAGLFLSYNGEGKLSLRVESGMATQQPIKPDGSNSIITLNGGWPAYEFGDGTYGHSGICVKEDGSPSIRLWSRSTLETPNRFSVEFQDEFNLYQHDSLSLTDVEDVETVGHEVTAPLPALGIANFHQAARVLRRHLDRSIRGNTYVEFETTVIGAGLAPGDIITVTYLKEGLDRTMFRIIRMSPGLNYRSVWITAQLHSDSWYADGIGNALGGRRQGGGEDGTPRPLQGPNIDSEGFSQFAVSEQVRELADGSSAVELEVEFLKPVRPSVGFDSVPLLVVSPQVTPTGGSLSGGRSYYYAITGVNGGEESALSMIVRAEVPAGTTNQVALTGIRLPSQASALNVYRGPSPLELYRIASGLTPAASFTDTGLAAVIAGPPDESYDHAAFEWRLELLPPIAVQTHTANSVGNAALSLTVNEFQGMLLRLTEGTGRGQERVITGNTATTLTVNQAWLVEPDSTSQFAVAEASWRFGAESSSNRARFEVPNQSGATIHILGLAVSPKGTESPWGLGTLTRWMIGGNAGATLDTGIPVAPAFGLSARGRGRLELEGVAFSSLANTRSVESGVLTLHYWNELAGLPAVGLAAAVTAADGFVDLTVAGSAQVGDSIQIEEEVLRVDALLNSGTRYQVTRGSHGTAAATHVTGTKIFHLLRRAFVVPFPREFFGSPASGSYSHSLFLPDARVAAAEMYVTNSKGNSPVTRVAYTGTVDFGLRTLSGGQFTIQVEGPLAIQTGAAPPLIAEIGHSVRDIFARVAQAPTGAAVDLRLKVNGATYCDLTIAAGAVVSQTVDGFSLGPLPSQGVITLDVISVGQTAATTPGRDLTVTIRL